MVALTFLWKCEVRTIFTISNWKTPLYWFDWLVLLQCTSNLCEFSCPLSLGLLLVYGSMILSQLLLSNELLTPTTVIIIVGLARQQPKPNTCGPVVVSGIVAVENSKTVRTLFSLELMEDSQVGHYCWQDSACLVYLNVHGLEEVQKLMQRTFNS